MPSVIEVYRHPDRFLIDVTGRDRAQWLHNLCTNDILNLATGRRGDSFRKGERVRLDKTPAGPGCFTAFCNRQGKMLAEAYVRLHEERIELATAERTLPDTLGKAIIMEDVTLAVREAPIHAVFGAGGGPIAPFVSPVIGPVEGPAMSAADYERRRIEAGWPKWGVDMDSTVLPMEAGLEPIAISYTKGCYVGQEVIQRVKTYSEAPRMLVHLEGDGLKIGEIEGGRVTSVSGRLALAYVKKDLKAPGTRLPDGAVVRELPWWKAL